MALITSRAPLPDWYQSLMSRQDKLASARMAFELTIGRGLTPVAASVTGSRLRGVDHEESDVDVLVLVSEKLPHAKTWRFSEEVEGQCQSIDKYAMLISRSVPYAEFQLSPFLVVEESYAPLLAALRPDPYLWQAHAERFVCHHLNRKSVIPSKSLRTALCVWWTAHEGTPLFPRHMLGDPPGRALDWIREVAVAGGVDHGRLAGILSATP